MKPTIYDVARETGLSIATVSRVINKKGKVKPETEEKVRSAITRLQYNPNFSAKGLAANKTYIISLMMNRMFTAKRESQYVIRFINGVLLAAGQHNYEVLIRNVSLDTKGAREESFSPQTDGAIFPTAPGNELEIQALLKKKFPVVYAGERAPFDDIGCNIYGGFHLYRKTALEILFQKGYRNVVMLETFRETEIETNVLYHKTMQMIAEMRNNYRDDGFRCTVVDYSQGFETFRVLLESTDRPDAVFINEMENYYLLSEVLNEFHLEVPKDIAVVATSHSKGGGTEFKPAISCIYLNAFEMGRKSGELLMKMIHQEEDDGDHTVEYQYIERESLPEKGTG